MNEKTLISIKGLKVELMSMYGLIYAVRNINLDIQNGVIHGIVGESGCGKSMTAKTIMRLHDESKTEYSGSIMLDGNCDILKMSQKELQMMRGKDVSMIFQDPMTALNPVVTIGKQMTETILCHEKVTKEEAKERAIALLEKVGIHPGKERFNSYPFEMSGGQLQRVCIAMSLLCNPRLLIADEPTTALDVTMQAQILELLKKLQRESNSSILIITHNFGVVAEICDVVSVMYAGQIVERGEVREIFNHPQHPYTQDLIACIPKAGEREVELKSINGQPPLLNNTLKGCPYATRCHHAIEKCFQETPQLHSVGKNHECMCFLAKEMQNE